MNGEKDVKWDDVNFQSDFQQGLYDYTYSEVSGVPKKEVGVDIGCLFVIIIGGLILIALALYVGVEVIQWLF